MRGLTRILVAEVVSTSGSALTSVALPWFVLTTTGSPTRSGLVMAAEIAPVLLLGLVSGGWAERLGVRRWMILSDGLRAPLVAAVPACYAFGALPFWLLLAIVFVVGFLATPYPACQQVLTAHLVGEDETTLARATATLQAATRLTLLIGPPTAGALIAVFGAPAVLLLDAASYLIAIPLVLGLPEPPRPIVTAKRGLFDGLRAVYADRLLGTWTTVSVLTELSYQVLFVAFPVLALLHYHTSAVLPGLLLAAFGAGAVAGSVLAGRVARRVAIVRLAVVGKVGQAIGFVALIAPLPAPGFVAISLWLGLFNGLTNGPVGAIRLRRLHRDIRARALTAIATITWLGGMAGLAGAGPAFEAFPFAAVFAALAIVQTAGAALFVAGARTRDRADSAPVGALAGNG